MDEIQRADPIARRRAMLLVVIGALLGGAAVLAFERCWPLIERWLLSDPAQLAQRIAAVTVFCVLLTAAPLAGFAAHLWIRGARVRQHQRFPLPGERLVRDTLVIRGEAAAIRGRVLQCLAAGLAVLAIALAVLLGRLAILVGTQAD